MGVVGFSAFSRANDLGNGLVFYPLIGIGAALLTISAAVAVVLQKTPLTHAWPVYVSATLALLHSLTTTRAAPHMLSLRQATNDEVILAKTLDSFARWHTVRTGLVLLNFIFLLWALIAFLSIH
jgi:uncharacterized membrane protein